MTEIEPLYFPPLGPSLLKDPNCMTLDSKSLTAIYKELLKQMEKWYKYRIPEEKQ